MNKNKKEMIVMKIRTWEEITEKLITEGEHSEESEEIWFQALKLLGVDGMRKAAQEC